MPKYCLFWNTPALEKRTWEPESVETPFPASLELCNSTGLPQLPKGGLFPHFGFTRTQLAPCSALWCLDVVSEVLLVKCLPFCKLVEPEPRSVPGASCVIYWKETQPGKKVPGRKESHASLHKRIFPLFLFRSLQVYGVPVICQAWVRGRGERKTKALLCMPSPGRSPLGISDHWIS